MHRDKVHGKMHDSVDNRTLAIMNHFYFPDFSQIRVCVEKRAVLTTPTSTHSRSRQLFPVLVRVPRNHTSEEAILVFVARLGLVHVDFLECDRSLLQCHSLPMGSQQQLLPLHRMIATPVFHTVVEDLDAPLGIWPDTIRVQEHRQISDCFCKLQLSRSVQKLDISLAVLDNEDISAAYERIVGQDVHLAELRHETDMESIVDFDFGRQIPILDGLLRRTRRVDLRWLVLQISWELVVVVV